MSDVRRGGEGWLRILRSETKLGAIIVGTLTCKLSILWRDEGLNVYS